MLLCSPRFVGRVPGLYVFTLLAPELPAVPHSSLIKDSFQL